jgi:hypothetical protein
MLPRWRLILVMKSKTIQRRKRPKSPRNQRCVMFISTSHVIHCFQVPKAADVSPENIAKNDNIKLLRGKWGCESADGSTHCWVSPADSSHVHLTNEHFKAWAEAIVRFNMHLGCAYLTSVFRQASGPRYCYRRHSSQFRPF